MKDPKTKKPKAWNQSTAFQPMADIPYQARKKQKKDQYSRGRD